MRKAGFSILGLVALMLALGRCRRGSGDGVDQSPVGSPALPGGAAHSLSTYLKSAKTLREIHSVKLSRADRASHWLKFALIGLSTVATCIGFIGIGDLADDLSVSSKLVTVVMNAVLLGLLIAVIAELSWRFGDRAGEHQRAIVVLTVFVRDLENRLREPIRESDPELVAQFGERHKLIIEILPPHTDRDYLRAKEATAKKQDGKRKIESRKQSKA